jgi:hypothetical protein
MPSKVFCGLLSFVWLSDLAGSEEAHAREPGSAKPVNRLTLNRSPGKKRRNEIMASNDLS